MDDFYTRLRENLENRPEPLYEEAAWLTFERKFNALESQSNSQVESPWIRTALLLLLLLSFGLNAWFFFHEKGKENFYQNTVYLTDTLIKNQLVIKRDTIIQTSFIQKSTFEYIPYPLLRIPRPVTGMELPFSFDGIKKSADGSATFQSPFYKNKIALTDLFLKNENPSFLFSDTARALVYPSVGLPSLTALPGTRILPKTEKYFFSLNQQPKYIPSENKKKSVWSHLVDAMQPEDIKMGLSGGWANPFSKGLNPKTGYSLGLELDVVFSKNLQLWLSADNLNLSYETGQMDESIGIPLVSPPSDDFTFEKAEIMQSSFQFATGMDYFFDTRKKKWKPLLGVGYSVVSIQNQDVNFNFENRALDNIWVFKQEVDHNQLLIDNFVLRTGMLYRPSDQFDWLLKASFRKSTQPSTLTTPSVFTFQTGLHYKF